MTILLLHPAFYRVLERNFNDLLNTTKITNASQLSVSHGRYVVGTAWLNLLLRAEWPLERSTRQALVEVE